MTPTRSEIAARLERPQGPGNELEWSLFDLEGRRRYAEKLNDFIDQQAREIAELGASRDAWRKAAQEMVPGGSEFTTPEACLRHNREQRTNLQESTLRAHGTANKARRQVAELEAKVAGLETAIRDAKAFCSNSMPSAAYSVLQAALTPGASADEGETTNDS